MRIGRVKGAIDWKGGDGWGKGSEKVKVTGGGQLDIQRIPLIEDII